MVPSHSISLAFLTASECLMSQVKRHFQALWAMRALKQPLELRYEVLVAIARQKCE